ncbi:hypothetical protein NKH98_31135 [Mesorhizobium sp. M0833]|uniref:hypothetical protein n=1 Tax=unclassified Mesorhizobium TaxID=325217 RepID=UPI00333AAABE
MSPITPPFLLPVTRLMRPTTSSAVLVGLAPQHDRKAAWIAKRRHLLDAGNAAAVEGLPEGLFQGPKRGLVEVHRLDRAVDVAALKALNYAAQDDVRADVVDRLDERGAQHRLIGRDKLFESLAR